MLLAGAGVVETDPSVHLKFGSNYGPLTWTGEPWRLLTSAFIHFGIFHIAFNMYALYRGGILTERLYGSARFTVIYLLSALAGSVVSGWWNPLRNSAGASGAIFGVYGALLVFFAMRRADIPPALLKSAGRGALTLCAYSLIFGATNPLVDNSCHVGGLLGGAAAGFLLVRPFDPTVRAVAQPWRLAGVSLAVCAALAALAAPLLLPHGSRAANLRLDQALKNLGIEESRLVDRFMAIDSSLKAGKLTRAGAAAQVESEVLRPWSKVAQSLRALSPIEPADSIAAQRLAAMQEYATAREQAYALTVSAQRNRAPQADEAVAAAWHRVEELAEAARKLDNGKR
jgi:rhomboid protease GluP